MKSRDEDDIYPHDEDDKYPHATIALLKLNLPPYDRALSTRNFCIAAILFSIALGILCFTASLWILTTAPETPFLHGLRVISVPAVVASFFPLLFNVVIAVCTEVIGYVHTTALRWALVEEGRLMWNSNLRLFTCSRRSWANGWVVNGLAAVLLAVCYTASGQMLSVGFGDGGPASMTGIGYVILNGVAMLMLSVGLLGLCGIAVLCLLAARKSILTWSPNPLNAALACKHAGKFAYRPGRGLMGVDSTTQPAQPTVAVSKQNSVGKIYKATRTVIKFLWAILVLNCLLAGIVCYYTFKINGENAYLSLKLWADHDYDVTWGTIGDSSWSAFSQLFYTFLINLALQSIVTMALHCVELIVNVARDEAVWRQSSTFIGTSIESSALGSALQCWQWWVLFATKPVAQWLFGSAGVSFQTAYDARIQFNASPLFLLVGITFGLVVFCEYMVRREMEGPQPAVFGHLQTLVDLVDDWQADENGRLFWGCTKASDVDSPGHVGTSSDRTKIEPVEVGSVYT